MRLSREKSILLLLAILTVGVFARVAVNDFVNYDDPDYVTNNPQVQQGLTWSGAKWAFANLHGQATYWHPLTWLSHMLDCQLFGLQPAGPHLVNLLFHAANTLLLFLLLKQMTGATWRSAFVAAVFAIHPLQVNTVAWVTERKNVLSGLFWIMTLLAYLQYARKGGRGRYGLMLLLFVAGLMCKPTLVTLPCAMLLLDLWPLRRWSWAQKKLSPASDSQLVADRQPAKLSFLIIEKIPLLLLAIGSSLITVLAHEGLGISQESHGLPVQLRIENALVSYVRYLAKFFWPARLAVLYPHPGKWSEPAVLGSFFLLAAITVFVVWQIRRRPFLFVGWFWFLGVLLPASGVLQIGVQAMADRFIYLPIIGLLIAVTWAGTELIARWRFNAKLATAGVTLLVAAFAVVSFIQIGYWKNSFTLWEHTISVTGPNALAHNNLTYALYLAGRFDEALDHALESKRIRPDFAEPRLQLGMILEAKGNPQDAIAHYREAVAIHPNWPLARTRLADVLVKSGDPAGAIGEYSAFLQIVPNDAETHLRMAELLSAQGKTAEGIAHYREVIRLKPDQPEALNNLAWIYATSPQPEFRNGKEAVALAARACEVTKRAQPVLIGTLAAAYAEDGQFDQAARTATEAMDAARAAGQKELEETNARLKQLYSERKPYRDLRHDPP
jgi:Tfp pilus assembly protein PilF